MVMLNPELQTSPDCLAIERLGEPLTDVEEAHRRSCSRCEAELSLWRSFNDSKPAADEGGAVQWIVSELRRRRTAESSAAPHTPLRGWLATLGWRPVAALAIMVLAVGTGYVVWDSAPVINPPAPGAQIYRESTVKTIAPSGDLSNPPSELTWEAIDGAVTYNVHILEIDRTLLWSGSTPSTRIELPRAVVRRIVPGKTLLWSVTATDGGGRPIAESGMQSFRVTVARSSGST
jgi:hypothetical protein